MIFNVKKRTLLFSSTVIVAVYKNICREQSIKWMQLESSYQIWTKFQIYWKIKRYICLIFLIHQHTSFSCFISLMHQHDHFFLRFFSQVQDKQSNLWEFLRTIRLLGADCQWELTENLQMPQNCDGICHYKENNIYLSWSIAWALHLHISNF